MVKRYIDQKPGSGEKSNATPGIVTSTTSSVAGVDPPPYELATGRPGAGIARDPDANREARMQTERGNHEARMQIEQGNQEARTQMEKGKEKVSFVYALLRVPFVAWIVLLLFLFYCFSGKLKVLICP